MVLKKSYTCHKCGKEVIKSEFLWDRVDYFKMICKDCMKRIYGCVDENFVLQNELLNKRVVANVHYDLFSYKNRSRKKFIFAVTLMFYHDDNVKEVCRVNLDRYIGDFLDARLLKKVLFDQASKVKQESMSHLLKDDKFAMNLYDCLSGELKKCNITVEGVGL